MVGRKGPTLTPGLAAALAIFVSAALGVTTVFSTPAIATPSPVAASRSARPSAVSTETPLADLVPGPLTVQDDRFVDADGRTVILHGLFGVWKIPGGLPPDNNQPDGFTRKDADTVASLGFDAFRLAWFWSDLEPKQGRYDASYLARYKRLATELEQRGLFVLADSQQDMYSSVFGGDGFPT
jgi:endoglycosylceramidase